VDDPILRVQDLSAEFVTADGIVNAINGVSFSVARGKTLVLMGESGSGKSSIGLSILNLLPHPGRITGGQVWFGDRDLLALPAEEMRHIRGKDISIVFQDPQTGLNPVLSVGDQVREVIVNHTGVSKREGRRRAVEVLREIGLPEPDEVAKRFPFQLSGGMAQRVMIAMATAMDPDVLILDEPTSALDVTIQAAILDDLRRMQERDGTAIMLITHDFGIAAQMADEVAVIYAGHVAERADARTLFARPRHPYTSSLLASRPRWDREGDGPLTAIKGTPPSLIDLPPECPFLPRCPKATLVCRQEPAPPLESLAPGHLVACYNPMYQEEAQEHAVGER
jgi:oligopeptide/dipeptide ABC transporter ATP-binding protein